MRQPPDMPLPLAPSKLLVVVVVLFVSSCCLLFFPSLLSWEHTTVVWFLHNKASFAPSSKHTACFGTLYLSSSSSSSSCRLCRRVVFCFCFPSLLRWEHTTVVWFLHNKASFAPSFQTYRCLWHPVLVVVVVLFVSSCCLLFFSFLYLAGNNRLCFGLYTIRRVLRQAPDMPIP